MIGGAPHSGCAAAEIPAGREVELHERARGQRARVVVREHDAQEAGFEARDARAEPALAAHAHLVRDVGERVRVHVARSVGQSVGAGAAEVDRAGVDEAGADHAHVVEQLDVPVAIFDRRADAGRGVADDAGMLLDDGPVRGRVLRGRVVGRRGDVGAVRVDRRSRRRRRTRARPSPAPPARSGTCGFRVAARDAVERGFDDHGCCHVPSPRELAHDALELPRAAPLLDDLVALDAPDLDVVDGDTLARRRRRRGTRRCACR